MTYNITLTDAEMDDVKDVLRYKSQANKTSAAILIDAPLDGLCHKLARAFEEENERLKLLQDFLEAHVNSEDSP